MKYNIHILIQYFIMFLKSSDKSYKKEYKTEFKWLKYKRIQYNKYKNNSIRYVLAFKMLIKLTYQ